MNSERKLPENIDEYNDWFGFFLEEYKTLREEIGRHDQSRRIIESSVAIGLIVAYGWIIEKKIVFSIVYLYYFPILFVLAAACREWAYRVRISHIARYIRTIEDHAYFKLQRNAPWGWETHLVWLREDPKNKVMLISVVMFWCVLLFVCICLSEYLIHSQQQNGLFKTLFLYMIN